MLMRMDVGTRRGHLTKRNKSYVKEMWGLQEGVGLEGNHLSQTHVQSRNRSHEADFPTSRGNRSAAATCGLRRAVPDSTDSSVERCLRSSQQIG